MDYLADIWSIEELEIYSDITNCKPMKNLENLKRLTIKGPDYIDYSWMENLDNVEELVTYSGKCKNIKSLLWCEKLNEVYIGCDEIEPVETDALKQLINKVEYVSLSKNIDPRWNVVVEKTSPTTELTQADIKRLQSYPIREGKPEVSFCEIDESYPETHNWIYDTFMRDIILEPEEKIFTSNELTYVTWNNHLVIRYILQTTQDNGTIIEQDKEFEFFYGGWGEPTFYKVDFFELGGKVEIKNK